MTIDAELSGQLGDLAVLLNVKRDRNAKDPKVIMVSESGKVKQVGFRMKPYARLSFSIGEKQVELFANDDKYPKLVRDKTRELSKKQKIQFIESSELPNTEKYFIKNKFYDDGGFRNFGGELMHRAVAKICVNRYLYKGFDPSCCSTIINFLKGAKEPYPHFYYFPKTYNIHELAKDEVSHIVHIRGDSKTRVVYCYIELFNFENALIIFDMHYTGQDFEDTYALDPISGTEIEKKIRIKLSRNHFEALNLVCLNFHNEYVFRYNRVLKIIEKRQMDIRKPTPAEK